MSDESGTTGVNRRHYLVLALMCLLGGAVYATLVGLVPDHRPGGDPDKPASPIRLMLGGDILVGERLNETMDQKGAQYFLGELSSITQQADLHFANLEAPVTHREQTSVDKQFILRSEPDSTRSILDGLNVDGVSLANNHTLDYEEIGLLNTMRYLTDWDIKYSGAGANENWASRPVYFERKQRTVGLLSFSNTYPESFWATPDQPGTAFGDPDLVSRQVEETARESDVTVVSFHWGSELDTRPKDYQKRLARQAVRDGADVVFGHHPHSIQPYERYRDGVIFYSLGNYFFTTLSDDVDHGLVADVTIGNDQLEEVRFHVLNVNNYEVGYRPDVVLSFKNGARLARFLDRPDFGNVAMLGRDRP